MDEYGDDDMRRVIRCLSASGEHTRMQPISASCAAADIPGMTNRSFLVALVTPLCLPHRQSPVAQHREFLSSSAFEQLWLLENIDADIFRKVVGTQPASG